MTTYWGDLHNHCAVSYGRGVPTRALANARQHLDFCAITGHAFWPDMPMDLKRQDRIIGMHLAGFAKLRHFWPRLLENLQAAHVPGTFVTFPSYEWHSMAHGDYNCYVADDALPLLDATSPKRLHQALADAGHHAMVLPHHIGYTHGYRGLNWSTFDATRSPVVEIFSNHGCSEADDAWHDYHHSMGPRNGPSTARAGLVAGHRFGFYASTDSHDGYPGHYGHGRVGVIADQLTREAIWKAIWEKRTIASTGARIDGRITLGDAGIGGQTRRRDQLPMSIHIEGTAPLAHVDLVHGDGSGWTVQPMTPAPTASAFQPGRHKLRIECGWGRGDARTAWELCAQLDGGRILGVEPCFRYSGYDNTEEEPTEKITRHEEDRIEWICHSTPNPAGLLGGTHFMAGGTQSINLDLDANEQTRIAVRANGHAIETTIAELTAGSIAKPVGEFGSPALKIHRAAPEHECRFTANIMLETTRSEWGFVYLRVVQRDGQMAWLSPIWYET